MKRLLVLVPIALLGILVAAAPAQAERACTGTIGAETVGDDIEVPNGATCTLNGTTVDGNVEVDSSATLRARGVTVEGNIQAENHQRVTVDELSGRPSRIDGDIQLEDGGVGIVHNAVLGGNLQVEDNNGDQEAVSNRIDGDLQAFDNNGDYRIFDNRIGGNLQCGGNQPAPYGAQNAVEGDKEGQCANLKPKDGSTPPPPGDPDPPPGDPTPPPPGATAPRIAVGGPVVMLARRLAFIRAACSEACRVEATGIALVRHGRNAFRVPTGVASGVLAARKPRLLVVRMSARVARTIARAARSPRFTVRYFVRASAFDAEGNGNVRWASTRVGR